MTLGVVLAPQLHSSTDRRFSLKRLSQFSVLQFHNHLSQRRLDIPHTQSPSPRASSPSNHALKITPNTHPSPNPIRLSSSSSLSPAPTMSSKLDQLVKGAPAAPIPIHPLPANDPLNHLPSSPPQIYLNLLILEASLRSQYLELRARRRQHTFFLSLLGAWTLYFGYALFLAPREDGSGVGGSVYWVVEVAEKVCFMGGLVTGLLVWGTGQWERGVRWPRRWVGIANRGLRSVNLKVVVVKGPWWKEWLSTLGFFFSSGLFGMNSGSSYRYIEPSLLADEPNVVGRPGVKVRGYEEDLSPGGDTISLLLLPKPFSPTFRENWDVYRTAYWEKENERRRRLAQKLAAHEKAQRGQLSWWKRWRWSPNPPKDIEKHGHSHSHSHVHAHAHVQHKSHLSVSGQEKRLRSSTPIAVEERKSSQSHSRRSSTASNISTGGLAGKKKRSAGSIVRERDREGMSRAPRPVSSISNLSTSSTEERDEAPEVKREKDEDGGDAKERVKKEKVEESL
jgi:hypothetical protein